MHAEKVPVVARYGGFHYSYCGTVTLGPGGTRYSGPGGTVVLEVRCGDHTFVLLCMQA
jgi:hypothetical protein